MNGLTALKAGLRQLLEAQASLRAAFPERRFTLDGNLIGDIGEAAAQIEFDFTPARRGMKRVDGHGFRVSGERVEAQVKLTQGDAIRIRYRARQLLVYHLSDAGSLELVYNGPGDDLPERDGAYQTVSLRERDARTADALRLRRREP